ncbi:antitoxin Xre/MbcA/ParS toxin-binding domain-containing protein [Pseudomonas frederiksbergensis]|uniref:antitoxin Xre/MbcA/ParS toxin-binding domain-containing protein n=1 Tax=Pseudomonas frederiksbergensis TaxID=104087 RepID=UPI003D23DFCC
MLFEDDVTAAMEWMSSPARGLGSKRPLERARVETRAFVDLIGLLESGVLV